MVRFTDLAAQYDKPVRICGSFFRCRFFCFFDRRLFCFRFRLFCFLNCRSLIFLSLDQGNLTDLHGSADFSFGQTDVDQETYTVTRATAMVQPKGTFHLPLVFTKVEKPMIFITLSRH